MADDATNLDRDLRCMAENADTIVENWKKLDVLMGEYGDKHDMLIEAAKDKMARTLIGVFLGESLPALASLRRRMSIEVAALGRLEAIITKAVGENAERGPHA